MQLVYDTKNQSTIQWFCFEMMAMYKLLSKTRSSQKSIHHYCGSDLPTSKRDDQILRQRLCDGYFICGEQVLWEIRYIGG